MAKTIKKRTPRTVKSLSQDLMIEEKTTQVSFRFPKKTIIYSIVILAAGALIYFGGRMLFAASVNGQLVSRVAVVKELEKQGGKKTLDVLILKTIINQEAKKNKVTVSDKEVDAELSKIEKNVTSQGATLDSLLVQQGMTKDSLKEEIRLQILITKMVGSDITVTDKEIDDYIAAQKEQSSLLSTETEPATSPSKESVKEQLKQQKLQEKIQNYIADLKAKAKINYFVSY